MFDFKKREWYRGPSTGKHKPMSCSAIIDFGKHVEKKVMVLTKTLSKYGPFSLGFVTDMSRPANTVGLRPSEIQ